ncbi:hypothetical protein GCM10017600_10560 [Streptosporangium carneum]|uniref:Secreted protein n=1 Tax=Streptosporangium carneum TaxID=47481 RepID=A0A9W6HWK1_9ACTN|nr:hypothetical protein GCM10017600_10560 [Streptosporangium carneum]
MVVAALLTSVSAVSMTVALPASASASTSADHRLGSIRSSAAHGGYARATITVTGFSAETFSVYGTLYDRDGHRDHCAYIRARFHYSGGGTGWAQPRWFCVPSHVYDLTSDGEIRRVDVKICVYDRKRRSISHCRVETIRDEDLAN